MKKKILLISLITILGFNSYALNNESGDDGTTYCVGKSVKCIAKKGIIKINYEKAKDSDGITVVF